jgi:hypothetical protein
MLMLSQQGKMAVLMEGMSMTTMMISEWGAMILKDLAPADV